MIIAVIQRDKMNLYEMKGGAVQYLLIDVIKENF